MGATLGSKAESLQGLTAQEAAKRLAHHGPNAIPERRPPGVTARLLVQLRDPMILLLLGAAVLTVVLGDLTDLAVIAAVVVVNSVVGVAQELRAERALAAFKALTGPTSRVRRGGRLLELPARELVPGDVIALQAGDVVPADGVLWESVRLSTDEAALTGESVPVSKRTAVSGVSPDASQRVQAGTVVTGGRGIAVVTATGPDSAIGRIATLLGATRPRPTPLQRRLRDLGQVLAFTALALSAVVMVSGLLRGRPAAEMVLTAVSLAVAAVPESLPAVVTLALALGARRMADEGAVVRKLPAVETLGSVTVIATDKTGTLTVGRMHVEEAHASGAPEELLRDVVLCNDAAHDPRGAAEPHGDPLDVALLQYAETQEVDADALRATHERVGEIPFDADRRRMTTVHRTPDGAEGFLVVCKGAPEALLEAGLLESSVGLQAWRDRARRMAGAGLRVLGVADGATPRADPETAERRLTLRGLVGIADPPRPDAAAVLSTVQEAGVDLVMVTGDHPATASAIADRLRFPPGDVLTGEKLAEARPGDGLPSEVPRIFARIRPDQKLDIVAALQGRGHVVAMTGDGVNDAPALRRADVGVAVGSRATEVAREAADLVLTDDRLGTLVKAIAEGRRVYGNVRTFLRYALAGGCAEVLVMLLGPAAGLAIPLLPAQILWINLLTHGLPGVAFGAEPAAPEAMRRPPRPPSESVLGRGLWRQVLVTGFVTALSALGAGLWAGGREGHGQTATFLALGLGQLGVALALRRGRPGGPSVGFLDVTVALAVLLQLATVAVAPLAGLLATHPLPAADLAVVGVASALPGLSLVAGRLVTRATGTRASPA